MALYEATNPIAVQRVEASSPLAEATVRLLWATVGGRDDISDDIVNAFTSNVLTAAVGGEIVSAIVFDTSRRTANAHETYTYISSLGTAPVCRRRGYGRLLVGAALTEGLNSGDTYAKLSATPNSMAFYERLGFWVVRKQPLGRNTPMRLDITPDVVAALR